MPVAVEWPISSELVASRMSCRWLLAFFWLSKLGERVNAQAWQ